MKLTHLSDTHGYFPTLPKNKNLVVHTGDILPNKAKANFIGRTIDKMAEREFQRHWLIAKADTYRIWLDGRTMLFTRGNHDFSPLIEPILKDAGCKVIDLTNKLVQFEDNWFYGFPYIPFCGGEWNFELQEKEMIDEVNKIPWDKIDILAAHAPIAGILDISVDEYMAPTHYGIGPMNTIFSYKLRDTEYPKAYLCGHIHSCHGVESLGSMIVSNAATIVRELEIE